MSNPEVESVVADSKELTGYISTGDNKLEEMIRRAGAVNGKGQCMKDYQSCIDCINSETANGKRRAVLLSELQRENKLIMAYQEENRILKDAVEECFNTLGSIMSRHRTAMESVSSKPCPVSFSHVNKVIQDQTSRNIQQKEKLKDIVSGLTGHMENGEQDNNLHMEKFAQLRQEHTVLREMLATAEISNPGATLVFSRAVRQLEKRRSAADPDSISDDEMLNNTVIEVAKSSS